MVSHINTAEVSICHSLGMGHSTCPRVGISKKKEFMVLPRSGFGGLHWKAQGSVLGQRCWHLLVENCSALCCRMKNKMYHRTRQKQLPPHSFQSKHQASGRASPTGLSDTSRLAPPYDTLRGNRHPSPELGELLKVTRMPTKRAEISLTYPRPLSTLCHKLTPMSLM